MFSYYNILEYELLMNIPNFCNKLNERFMTGMHIKDAEITLINEFENSSSSYTGAMIDILHHYKNNFMKE